MLNSKSIKEAQSDPINNFSNDMVPKIIPYFIQTIIKYGMYSKLEARSEFELYEFECY